MGDNSIKLVVIKRPSFRRAKQIGQCGDNLQRSGVADPIIDALPHSACGNDFLLAHDGQMLRQCRLAEANTQFELTDAKLSFGELAKDHEPPLVRKHAQQSGGAGGALSETREIDVSKINKVSYILIVSNLY